MAVSLAEIRFVSSNKHKIAEAKEILEPIGITVSASELKIEELQTTDTSKLVHDKLLKAFQKIGRPLFVEHTGLYLRHLNELPGGLTQIFWDSLQADRFSELFGRLPPVTAATARTTVAYCDGRKIHDFTGEITGIITGEPRGPRGFQWDCVFKPDGHAETFAEMGDRKNAISMRRLALDKLANYLKRSRG
jgi:XTP/dITP diphosphohydrolase